MLKRFAHRILWLSVLGMLALVFSGCAPQFEIIASSSHLPSAAQVEEQTIRQSIPPDLRKRMEKAIAKSQAQAGNVGRNKQYVAQMPNPQVLLEKKLLETVLAWAGEKPSQERLVLQQRRSTFETIVEESRDPDKPEASWRDNQHVQYGAGVVAGAAIGTVPLGPYAAGVAIELKVLPKGTYYARVGKCAGELISGVIQMAAGCSGMTTGIGITGTGGGAPAGAIVISASFALAANGYATSAHALDEAQRLWNEGPPPDAPASAPPEKLLKPKTRPKQPATTAPPAQATPAQPALQAKPVPPAKPATAVTRNKKSGEVLSTSTTSPTGSTRAVTQPKQAPGQTQQPVAKPRGGDSPAAARGRQVHDEFKEKVKAKKEKNPGWDEKPRLIDSDTKKELRPDALTPSGRPLELKPNTPSGRAAGARQLKKYEAAAGKKGRVLYYDP